MRMKTKSSVGVWSRWTNRQTIGNALAGAGYAIWYRSVLIKRFWNSSMNQENQPESSEATEVCRPVRSEPVSNVWQMNALATALVLINYCQINPDRINHMDWRCAAKMSTGVFMNLGISVRVRAVRIFAGYSRLVIGLPSSEKRRNVTVLYWPPINNILWHAIKVTVRLACLRC